eukprot:3076165-Rhodomonas_salina.1
MAFMLMSSPGEVWAAKSKQRQARRVFKFCINGVFAMAMRMLASGGLMSMSLVCRGAAALGAGCCCCYCYCCTGALVLAFPAAAPALRFWLAKRTWGCSAEAEAVKRGQPEELLLCCVPTPAHNLCTLHVGSGVAHWTGALHVMSHVIVM